MPARDVVDPSLIVDRPRKRKMASYVTNEDNGSADKMETIKRIKRTVGLADSQASLEDNEGATVASGTQKRKAPIVIDSSDEENIDTDVEEGASEIEVVQTEETEHELGKSVQKLCFDYI
jgi:hypothetical protein